MKKTLLITAFFMLVSIFSFAQTSAEGYFDRGNSKYDLQDYRGAIQDYSKAIELDPSNADAYYNRGNAKRKLQDYRGAIQDYSKAIELDPSKSEAYGNRGLAKYFLNDIDGACLDWSKAGELGIYDAYDSIKEYCN